MSEFKFTPQQEAWLQALESGTYKQGKNRLCLINPSGEKSYCCLGVAYELAREPLKLINTVEEKFGEDKSPVYTDGKHNSCAALIPSLKEYYGFMGDTAAITSVTSTDPLVDDGRPCSLASANDTYDWSFQKIAEFVRANPERVFTNAQIHT